MRLNVQLACDLANVPPAPADAFKASADRLFNAALERVKELAAAYAGAAEPPRPVEIRDACRGRHFPGGPRRAACPTPPRASPVF